MEHRRRITLSAAQQIWIAPPEYVIIRKLEFFRLGGSDKHLQDIKNMIPQIEDELDQIFLDKKIEEKGLSSFWQKILLDLR